MKEDEITFDEYRTGYISERWDVSDNCAKALQLFELGFSVRGASKRLPVSTGTVKKYHNELTDKIHPNVVLTITGTEQKFDVWGDRTIENYTDVGYEEGVNDAKSAKDVPSTSRKNQVDKKFQKQKHNVNKGISLSEIPKELITLHHSVTIDA